jgi:hypothetical protein
MRPDSSGSPPQAVQGPAFTLGEASERHVCRWETAAERREAVARGVSPWNHGISIIKALKGR